jgi:hypothetical protein
VDSFISFVNGSFSLIILQFLDNESCAARNNGIIMLSTRINFIVAI